MGTAWNVVLSRPELGEALSIDERKRGRWQDNPHPATSLNLHPRQHRKLTVLDHVIYGFDEVLCVKFREINDHMLDPIRLLNGIRLERRAKRGQASADACLDLGQHGPGRVGPIGGARFEERGLALVDQAVGQNLEPVGPKRVPG